MTADTLDDALSALTQARAERDELRAALLQADSVLRVIAEQDAVESMVDAVVQRASRRQPAPLFQRPPRRSRVRDPFKIDSPTCISFSGGRTSGYMLWRVRQSNGGLPAEAPVCFANTGKEDEATLRFVRDCSARWAVPIIWLEYRADAPGYAVVDFDTASRNGEPFEAVIRSRKYLPNPVARFCTVEMKILPAAAFMRSLGFDEWDNMVGFRADEPRRVAKLRANPSGGTKGVERCAPLADAGVSVRDVAAFWNAQSFDLGLPNINGKAMHGNCDLCFLKPPAQRPSLIREKPERAIWWARMEASIQSSGQIAGDGARFTKDGPSYADMARNVRDQTQLSFDADQEAIDDCFCGD
jgi:3'-phosphoadenosine 5'-phosphosulfate sulfotransferase (PAPS reductase)/FAD synthetase